MHHDARWRLNAAVAFAAVYLIWGSTYLAIRIGVQELPPALFAGVRFLVAGALLAAVAGVSRQAFPRQAREWRIVIVSAIFMLGAANGLVVWGEQWVASNQAALLVATTALWLAGFGMLGAHGQRLTRRTVLGLALGFFGAAALLLPQDGFSFEHFGAQLAILAASLSWSAGSIYVKRMRPATAPLMSAALQSFAAGVLLTVIGLAAGEGTRWVWTPAALWSLAYLIVFGSCLAYAAYVWLLHSVSPAALGTYAYVNPAVAVVLGWFVLEETLNPAQLGGMVVILLGVVLVTTSRPKAVIPPAQR